ncbi:F-box only protein 25 [Lingula anatina]|uniref:F-box only protein 25 n=1 Tax=Lingula anatina TaxID=7574 RepID=A0A1S3JJT6_LINAN|nr:F-box only protein 25 [Lingula anatina]|eukprot:XP_013410633.1 F-box only protein 25 [Lingula anatina]
MPFLGKDWRSPGEQWVRTDKGWERMRMWRLKLLENLNENVVARIIKLALEDMESRHSALVTHSQPHIYVAKTMSREHQMQISLGDVLTKLDFAGAAKNIRRFNYVCKLLDVLINEKLQYLGGQAQKQVFSILEAATNYVVTAKTNTQLLKQLLVSARQVLIAEERYHLGSPTLWQNHMETVNRAESQLATVLEPVHEAEEGSRTLADLPNECLWKILGMLSDHLDIVSTGLTKKRLYEISAEELLWRELCLYHFTYDQVNNLLVSGQRRNNLDWNWKKLYLRLVKRHGKKEVYADMLHLCDNCNCVFWKGLGHPCLSKDGCHSSTEVSPHKFLQIFNP